MPSDAGRWKPLRPETRPAGHRGESLALEAGRATVAERDRVDRLGVGSGPIGTSGGVRVGHRLQWDEDGRDWPEAFQRVSVEPDRAGAKAVLQLGASADPRDLAALTEAGVRVRPNVTLGWRS
jgi:hypothetical protein